MQTTINCKGKLLSLEKPLVMGVLNITPDSFYDGGRYTTHNAAIAQAEKMLLDGADIIDVGGMSSKQGNTIISIKEELNRVLPIIESIIEKHPDAIISIDTLHAEVAKKAIEKGAAIVNDITAGRYDSAMLKTVATLHVPYIAMHIRGLPENMMQYTDYDNVTSAVLDYFVERLHTFNQYGIADIIIDPGFGFSKTLEQNYELLHHLHILKILERPILVGVSRKSMIKKLLNISGDEALNGTTALNTIALNQGANILRVHDVKEAVEVVKIMNAVSKNREGSSI